MATIVAIVCATAAIALGALLWVAFEYGERMAQKHEAAVEQHLRYVLDAPSRRDHVRQEERARCTEAIAEVQREHMAEIRRMAEAHEAEMNRTVAFYASQIERALAVATYGQSTPKPVEATTPPPDAELAVRARVAHDTIEAGARALQAEYAARGIVVGLDEVREEARSMLAGVTPAEGITAVPFIRDNAHAG